MARKVRIGYPRGGWNSPSLGGFRREILNVATTGIGFPRVLVPGRAFSAVSYMQSVVSRHRAEAGKTARIQIGENAKHENLD